MRRHLCCVWYLNSYSTRGARRRGWGPCGAAEPLAALRSLPGLEPRRAKRKREKSKGRAQSRARALQPWFLGRSDTSLHLRMCMSLAVQEWLNKIQDERETRFGSHVAVDSICCFVGGEPWFLRPDF